MTLNIGNSMALNTGSYFGSGYSGSYNSSSKVASSTNLNRVARDIASGYSSDIETIGYYFENGDSEQAIQLYQQVLDDVKQTAAGYGYELSDGQIASVLNQSYQNNTGSTFSAAASENTHSSFVAGFLQGVPVLGLMADSNSKDEAIAKTAGRSVKATKMVVEGLGGILSGAATGAAAGAIGCTPFSIAAGAIVGGVVGLAQVIGKNLFSI